jgi:hypothetical protein
MTDSAAYMFAFAALVGTFVGGVTSIATSWLGQQSLSKDQRPSAASHSSYFSIRVSR